jgi:FkbM family methyltransferase
MLINLHYLVTKYKINFKGILHVGAHECEELNDYERYINRNKILWIDALLDKVEKNKNNFPNLLIEQAVVSDKEEIVKFNRSNNGQSSSILEFGLHSKNHPHVWFVDTYDVKTILLKDILPKYNIDYNFLNLDIQGAELKALKGMEEYLNKVDYIYTEVNEDYVYKDCALVTEIDDYLKQFGLYRVETKWCENYKWGDAFYIRK